MILLKKAARTAQNYFPGLGEVKNGLYHWSRKTFRLAHDRDFRALAIIPPQPNDLFLDIGANRGQSILSMRCFRPDAPIVSFEPSPKAFAWLQAHFHGAPGLRLENFGLGAKASVQTLYTPRYRGFAYDGLATFSREGAREFLCGRTLFGFDPDLLEVDEAVCETRTLDSLGLAPTFVKIDVEGWEHAVIEGAMATFSAHEPVLLVERYYDNPRASALIEQLGYVEVIADADGLRPGAANSENGLWATPARLTALKAFKDPRHA